VNDRSFSIKENKRNYKVHRQVVLPFNKSVEIAFTSIRVRFFRSLITLSLILAISFLSFINVSTDVANGMLSTNDTAFRQALIKSGYDLKPEEIRVENSPKQRWLLVCVVGIVNAQLMAVTERFREIGTMKCLGALDRFVLRLFLLEAGMQGVAGAGFGAFAGCFFAVINTLLRFGSKAVMTVIWEDMVMSVFIAIGVGIMLSLVGVLYPAILAARMQPVEAMRVEQ
jgi:hypothetical protein